MASEQKIDGNERPPYARALGVSWGEFQTFVRDRRHVADASPAEFDSELRQMIERRFDEDRTLPYERAALAEDVELKIEEAHRLASLYRALDRRGLLK